MRRRELEVIQGHIERFMGGETVFLLVTGALGSGKSQMLGRIIDSLKLEGIHVITSRGKEGDQDFDLLRRGLRARNLEDYIEERPTRIDAVLFIYRDGRSICSSQRLESEMDMDIFGGMCTAVEGFVCDSFSQAGKELKEIDVERSFNVYQYENFELAMLRFRYGSLTCMIEGDILPSIKSDLNTVADKIELRYREHLENWFGESSVFEGLESELIRFIIDKYTGELPDVDPRFRNLRIKNRFVERTEKGTEKAKLAFCLDDLHLADRASLDALRFLHRNVNRNVLVIASSEGRPADIGLEDCIEVGLGGLSASQVVELLERHGLECEGDPPSDFIEGLLETTGGNQLVVEENLMMLKEEGVDLSEWRDELDERGIVLLRAPDEVITRRIKRLGQAPFETLQWAATIGYEFEVDLLREVYPPSSDIDLRGVSIIERSGEGAFRFIDSRIRFSILAKLGDPVGMHRRVAEAMEARYGRAGGKVVHRLAQLRLFIASETGDEADIRKAIECLLESASRYKSVLENDSAIDQYQSCVKLIEGNLEETPATIQDRIGVYELMAKTQLTSGRNEQCVETNMLVVELADRVGAVAPRINALNQIAYCYILMKNPEKILEYAAKALKLAVEAGDEEGVFEAKFRMSGYYFESRQYEKAAELCWEAYDIAVGLGDEGLQGKILQVLALNYTYLRDFGEAFKHYVKALALVEKYGTIQEKQKLNNNMGYAHQLAGDYEEAIACYARAIEYGDRIGDLYSNALTYSNMATTYRMMGDVRNTLAASENCYRLAKRLDDRWLVTYPDEERALVHLQQAKGAIKSGYGFCKDFGGGDRLKEYLGNIRKEIAALREAFEGIDG